MTDLQAIAKDAAERVHENGGCVPQLSFAPILFALQDAFPAAPVSPDSDLLKEAVGLLRRFDAEWNSGSGWAVRMDDLGDDARAFLSKVEERGHD